MTDGPDAPQGGRSNHFEYGCWAVPLVLVLVAGVALLLGWSWIAALSLGLGVVLTLMVGLGLLLYLGDRFFWHSQDPEKK